MAPSPETTTSVWSARTASCGAVRVWPGTSAVLVTSSICPSRWNSISSNCSFCLIGKDRVPVARACPSARSTGSGVPFSTCSGGRSSSDITEVTEPSAASRTTPGASRLIPISGMMNEVPAISTGPPSSGVTMPAVAVVANRPSSRVTWPAAPVIGGMVLRKRMVASVKSKST